MSPTPNSPSAAKGDRIMPPLRASGKGSGVPHTGIGKDGFPSRLLTACLLLTALTLIAYWPVQGHDFVNYDDYRYVLENPHVRAGLTLQGVLWSFRNLEAGLWHPFTWVSHMLDCEIYGLRSGGHHWTSLLLHIGNGLLLFLFLRRTTGSFWKGWWVALFFLLHPLHVESVAWISERKDVLSTFFGMAALLAYAGYAESPAVARYLLFLLFWSMSLMAKPMLVTFPLLLLVLDYWPLRRLQSPIGPAPSPSAARDRIGARLPGLVLEKLPLLAVSVLFVLLTFRAERHVGALPSLEAYPPAVRILNALNSYMIYLLKMVMPLDLSPIYLHPGTLSWAPILGSFIALSGITFFAFWTAPRRPYLLSGWLWYLIALLPVIGLVQIGSHVMADRYTYVPLVGAFIMVVWGLSGEASRWKYGKRGLLVCGGLAVLALVPATRAQVLHWRNSVTLFEHAVEATEDNFLAHHHLGFVLSREGDYEEARRHYKEALRIRPDYPEARYGLGVVLERLGREEEAIRQYSFLVAAHPGYGRPHYNLGNIYLRQGRVEEAVSHYEQALRIDPKDPRVHNNLGLALERQGRFKEAMHHYRRAVRFRSADSRALHNLERLKGTLESGDAPQ